ncbi:MAG: helix-turn-helix domain-containing protein [Oceanospirillaceae bacterium]|nr:helix-turn-helix domain-containing protein [Oceanospirillaceae bacterium]
MSEIRLQQDLFNQLLSLITKAGITQEQLLHQARINGLSASDSSIFSSIEAVILLSTAAELINDPYLGIRLGQQVGIDSYGTFGFAIMSCANLRESIELLLRYGKVFFKPHWESENHNGGLWLWHNLTKGTPAQQRLIAELSFSQMSLIGNSLYRSRLKGAELQLIYSEPPDSAYYQSLFDIKVIFGAERNQLFLPEHILDTPVKTANVSDHVVFHQQCEGMLRSLTTGEKVTTEVRPFLLQSAGDFFDINQVAARLNMSERSLRRRLNAESVSFRTLFEEVRDLLATEYLAKTDLTVAEIAHLLSYSETVNFRRAFMRWNGTTPSEYRLQKAR